MTSLSDFVQLAQKRKAEQLNSSGPDAKRRKYMTKKEREEEAAMLEKQRQEQEQKEKEAANQNVEELRKSADGKEEANEAEQQQPTKPREEVIRRLREAGRVVTYFGESDYEREKRWLEYETDKEQSDEYQKGLKNDLDIILRQIEESEGHNDSEDMSALLGRKKKKKSDKDEELQDPFPDAALLENVCHEDVVLLTLKRVLKVWERDLEQRFLQDDSFKRSAKGKKELGMFRQTEIYLKPLFKHLRKRTLPQDILQHMMNIVMCMRMREYMMAADVYLQMSIGNSPWPIGVTMVGIHERSAREKIHSNQIAHVLNDETQRKYIQSVKRIMTFCQKKYPTDPSKCVG